MSSFGDPDFYGDRYAHEYDDRTELDPTAAVAFLAALVPAGGRVLELAAGTGRVTLPLAARGVRVEGIEGSAAMVERMRARPGGAGIPVVVGDMADLEGIDGPYDMAYLVFNTLFNLTSQERQVDCFRNVARVLRPGGRFVIEAFVQDVAAFDNGQRVAARALTEESVDMEYQIHDPVAQTVTYQRVTIDAAGTTLRPLLLRYAWPSELDLMARLAGLRRTARYTDWDRSPFTGKSTRHVTVYERE
ncbi:methyltransferase [Asanoa ishikariensis]|uniref:Methyltransferase domain-containing protein n=1 Tax=Asanoa ishikariensis TaxID=137265 RepID=A0A1H3UG48_9ACTN|nr:class I SAM-dependent methyltransferase [Asanoa ishikariensis]GIF63607.1 methyltransferase [Asanoa ishikariensis]SDZ61358.1 Methyltransferase domain-containing protein [Asanoa ishikariensis]